MKGLFSVLAAAVCVCGCASGQMGVPEEKSDDLHLDVSSGEKLYHEWQKVYVETISGKQTVREHVGFLDRRFTMADPEGKTFVMDRLHRARGFVLPSGKAFLFQGADNGVESKDLGNTGFDTGVKRILDVAGAIVYERVATASTSPRPQG